MLTYRSLITRALVVGLAAGAVVALYTVVFVEPTIDRAIALEEATSMTVDAASGNHDHQPEGSGRENGHDTAGHDSAGHDHGDEPLFSRPAQVRGGVAAIIIYGVIVAGIFATVFGRLRHRLPGATDQVRVLWLAAVSFGAVCLVPGLKYPANPPGVGNPDTVTQRTIQYAALLAASIALAVALTQLAGWLRRRVDSTSRAAIVAAVTIAGYGVLLVATPGSPDPIDSSVPAQLLWEFRIGSLGALALLWATIGFGLGWALERLERSLATAHPAVYT